MPGTNMEEDEENERKDQAESYENCGESERKNEQTGKI